MSKSILIFFFLWIGIQWHFEYLIKNLLGFKLIKFSIKNWQTKVADIRFFIEYLLTFYLRMKDHWHLMLDWKFTDIWILNKKLRILDLWLKTTQLLSNEMTEIDNGIHWWIALYGIVLHAWPVLSVRKVRKQLVDIIFFLLLQMQFCY